jgi:O-antigen/teichoic acid export membrane protein
VIDPVTEVGTSLVRKTTLVFIFKIVSYGLSLITAIVLARLLGASSYGIYTYAIALTGLLSIPATLGLDSLLVREVSIYRTQSAWQQLRGILRWTNWTVLLLSVGFALLAGGIAWCLWKASHPQALLAFGIALVSLPLTSLRSLRLAAMRGLHRIMRGLWPEDFLAPLLIIGLAFGAHWWHSGSLPLAWGMGIYVLVCGITYVVGVRLLNRILPVALREATPQYQVRSWIKSAFPLMFLDAMRTINNRTDILMIGASVGTEAVGIYTAALRGTQLITFMLVAVNTTLAPTVASLYVQGKLDRLQEEVTKTSRLISGVSLGVTIIVIGGSSWYLSLFGPEFSQGRNALIYLALGSFVNAATGSVGVLLNMTGHERYTAISMTVSAVLNVIGNALLIPRWGIEGAAIATAGSTIFINIVKVIWVHYKLGINSTAFGSLPDRPHSD